jgi:hypothetical protein
VLWNRHPVAESDLSAYADGELDESARARVDAHLEACAACREALTELRALRGALQALPRASAPRSFALREAEVWRPAPAARPSAFGPAMPALGGLAMVAFLGFWALVGLDAAGWPSDAQRSGSPTLSAENYQAADQSVPPPDAGRDGAEEPGGGEADNGAAPREAAVPTQGALVGAAIDTPEPPQEDTVAAETAPTPSQTAGAEDVEEYTESLAPAEATQEPETADAAPAPVNVAEAPELAVPTRAPPVPELAAGAPTPAPPEMDVEGGAEPAALERDEAAEEAQEDAGTAPSSAQTEMGDRGEGRLRMAEAAAAAVALAAGGSLALVWWRRRA